MDKVAVIIPCYNEEASIEKVVSDAKHVLPEATIYVYDNNSKDKTVEKAMNAGGVIRYEKKQGKGNVVRTAFSEIDAECYLIVDGDDTYGLDYAPEMVRRILKDDDDMVIGDRLHGAYYQENKKPLHNFGNKIVRAFVNLLFHAKNPDIMTGLRTFSYAFVKSFPSNAGGFEVETEMSIFAATNHLKTSSLIIPYRDRQKGSVSKVNTVKDGLKILRLIFSLFVKHKSLLFYGILSAIFFGLGFGFLLYTVLGITDVVNASQIIGLVFESLSLAISLGCLITGLVMFFKDKKERHKEQETIKLKREEFLSKKGK